jgi:hypothetical protein
MDAGLGLLILAAVTVGLRAPSRRSTISIPYYVVTAGSIPTRTREALA